MENYNHQIIEALDLAVFESTDGTQFVCVNTIPDWFRAVYPEISTEQKPLKLARKFLFLANFLEDAADLWKTQDKSRLKSGTWVATDAEGREYQIEATAINLTDKKILLLESGAYSAKEKELILSKSNAFAFDYKMLEAFERHETQIRADVKEKMEKEFQALRFENDALRKRISEMEKS